MASSPSSSSAAPAEAENIAVCIRVRPLNERETRSRDASVLCTVPRLNLVALTDEAGQPLGGKGHAFQYDHIFDTDSDARGMYEQVARRIVRSTLGGINGTIFAYGQTSSGKTFTMQGDGAMPFEPQQESSCRPGILQLAVEDIFSYIENCSDRDFLLRVSFLEIYNEVVKDLLNPTPETGTNLKLREDPRKGVYVECKEEIITNYEDIVTLLRTGNQHRTVGQTAMNDRSSRSHSVFRIVIESKQKSDSRRHSEEDVNGAVLVASLNLVDLAGSESLRHTGAEGIRQREAGNINKSLLTLARVINSLASSGGRGQNAPFRDSKLTRLLQNSLGGNTRTLIICCVTPSDRYIEETKSTLQFAARAKDIKTSATVNEVLDDQTQLRRLKREVHELKKLVNSEALNALKAENEALLTEKNHNKEEMARLMGLILSSASVTKTTVTKKRKQCGKRTRETWGPGDFPANLKSLAPLSPNLYPRKRHFQSKENMDPQILYRMHEDVPALSDTENPAFASVEHTFEAKLASSRVENKSKQVLDLFSSVFRSFRKGGSEDDVEEAIANEKCASLDDIQRARVFDLLGEIKYLVASSNQTKDALEEKCALQQDDEDLRAKITEQCSMDGSAHCNCSDNASKAGALVEEIMAELVSTQESLAKQNERCCELENEKTNSQQMAAEEVNSLRLQLEALRLESIEYRERFGNEKRQLETTLRSFQSGLLQADDEEQVDLRSKNEELERLVKAIKSSQTVLQLAVAERDEEIASLKSQEVSIDYTNLEAPVTCLEEQKALLQEKISEDDEEAISTSEASPEESEKEEPQDEPAVDQDQSGAAAKLAGELQSIMQELAQLQSDHEKAALEKEELQDEIERIGQELEVSQRQGYEMSEALMEKEHIAKVTQAQLDAKLMTISQMRTKHISEVETMQQTIHDLSLEKERLARRIQELEMPDGVDADSDMCDATESMCDATESTLECGQQEAEVETQKLCSERDQLTEKLLAAESKLAVVKERLEASLASSDEASEQSTLRTAFDKLKADYENLQMRTEDTLIEQQNPEKLAFEENSSADDQCLQARYDALNENYKRMADNLDKLSRERDDYLDELRALEAQLMEVSEEKMKLAITADEEAFKMRQVQELASSSAERIAALQAQLDEAQSAKTALEDSKAQLELDVENVQASLASLQADHNVVVEQLQRRVANFESGSDGAESEVELLLQRLEKETKLRERLELDVRSYEETRSVLRDNVKDDSHTIADLTEKVRSMQTDLDAASRAQELKDKELTKLADALTKSKEEEEELRFQRQQRMAAAEAKEMALEEEISSLEQQLKMSSTGVRMIHEPTQQTDILAAKEKEAKLQNKVTALEAKLAEARQQLSKQHEEWHKKQTMAEREFGRLTTEQQRLREQLSTSQSEIEAKLAASDQRAKQQEEELLKTKLAYTELTEQKEAAQHELETANADWKEKEQEMLRQMNSIREQFHEAQEELEEYKKNADDEIRRLHSLMEQTDAEIEEITRAAKAREEELENQIGEQEDWQNQVKSRQEALQAKCDELDDERRELHEKYAALEAERSDVEEQLRSEIHELSQKYAAAQAQQVDAEEKIKEMETRMEMTESDMDQNRSEMENLAEELKSAQSETVQYHNKLVEAQLAKESMEQLVEKQKARIDKLEKVKMTTETLDLFRRLKNDRQDLQSKVHKLQKDLAQAEQTREDRDQEEQRLVELRDKELKEFKEYIEELREMLCAEKQQAADIKVEMRATLRDEREKAEHEIQEMQALLKEKIDRAEKLEGQVASLEDELAKLQEQKGDNVSFLEKENLDLMVENRRLKKQLETSSQADKENEPAITGTFDASAAEAAKVLGAFNSAKAAAVIDDGDESATESPAHLQESSPVRAGGFLLSTTELNAIAGDSQEDPTDEARPNCPQQ